MVDAVNHKQHIRRFAVAMLVFVLHTLLLGGTDFYMAASVNFCLDGLPSMCFETSATEWEVFLGLGTVSMSHKQHIGLSTGRHSLCQFQQVFQSKEGISSRMCKPI